MRNLEPRQHITVAVVVENKGKFLLVEERINNRLVLNQPAGHVEADESIVMAAIRETLEETGLHFTPLYALGIYRWQTLNKEDVYFRHAFAGSVFDDGISRTLDEGIVRYVWMSYEDIMQANNLRSPLVLSVIEDYRNGVKLPLSMYQDISG